MSDSSTARSACASSLHHNLTEEDRQRNDDKFLRSDHHLSRIFLPRSKGNNGHSVSAKSVVCIAAAVVLLSATIHTSAFSLPFHCVRSPPVTIRRGAVSAFAMEAVRKRKGDFDFDVSSEAIQVQAAAAKASAKAKARGGRRRNKGFDRFEPRYSAASPPAGVASSLPTLIDEGDEKANSRRRQPSTNRPKKAVNSNIADLLADDEDDDDGCDEAECLAPDDSEEAANEIADPKAFYKMSDAAKLKVTRAVKREEALLAEEANAIGSGAEDLAVMQQHRKSKARAASESPDGVNGRRKIRANVQETGSDTMRQYVKSMGQHELLSKDDEVILGRQIQILVRWEAKRMELEEKLLRAPTFAQWAEEVHTTVPELKKQIRRSQRAKAALVEANLRLVVTVARQTVKKGRTEINFQDACQEGIIGLTRACEKFDPDLGFRFSTYAVWWIKKEVHRNVSEQGRPVRLPASAIKKINDIRIGERVLMGELGRKPKDEEVAERVGMTLEQLTFYRKSAKEVMSLDKGLVSKKGKGSNASGNDASTTTMEALVKDPSQSPADLASKEMLKNDVRRLIKTLSPKEQAVIRLRFGLDDGSPKTLDDIGKKFSVEKERIRKIEARALLKLRQPYRNQSVKCYISDL